MNNTSRQIHYTRFDSRLGRVIVARAAGGISGFWFAGQKHFAGPQADWLRDDDDAYLHALIDQYRQYELGERAQFDLTLAPHGTAFQRRVWDALREIPFGTTRSYAWLAHSIGMPQAVRAVGAAVGRNPISVVVPCHRVLGSDGRLTGYAGGLERKAALLAHEGAPH